ncbi:hypothetical protein Taro_033679 [Colocasia esculenta]|uniref:Uncharacterized protein n=1 Tax=Colocasia esculenta TaxID=4460 RepID=A0A843VUF9_COLES|nr:hypothetical protein [Colocasia esculenta]
MEYFLQGFDFQIWSIIEEGDLVVLNNRQNWTEDDKKKISLNYKAKSILCCALSKKEFNRVSACKSAMEMWEKLRIMYEGTYKVKETRIDILVTQYERFLMQPGESITQMYNRFTDITNGLAGLGKNYDMGDMELNGHLATVKIPGWRQHPVPLMHVGGRICAAKFFQTSEMAFAPILFPIFQNPLLFNSMAVSGVFGTVGGYGAAFL